MLNKLIKQKHRQDWFLGHILAFAAFFACADHLTEPKPKTSCTKENIVSDDYGRVSVSDEDCGKGLIVSVSDDYGRVSVSGDCGKGLSI